MFEQRFEAVYFFVGVDHKLLDPDTPIVDLCGDTTSGFFDVSEEGLDFSGDFADREGARGCAGRGRGVLAWGALEIRNFGGVLYSCASA